MKEVPVLPIDVLLVSFDLTHGDDKRLCIVAKKAGDAGAVDIVNAFQGEKAQMIFDLLTKIPNPIKEELKQCPGWNPEMIKKEAKE